MTIEVMTIDDYDAVYNLWIHTPGMGLNNLDDSRAGIEKYLTRNPKTCFVAKETGKVVGVILSGHDGRRGFIHHTAVDVSHRRQGIATKLVDEALHALRAEGITKAACVVFSANETGNRFWEAIGFEKRTDLTYRNKIISTETMERIDT